MKAYLKHQLSTLVVSIKKCKVEERKALFRGRALRGVWFKKHGKDQPKPEVPNRLITIPEGSKDKLLPENKRWNKWFRNEQWGNAVDEPVQQQAIDEAYERFWGFERFRKNQLRPIARHYSIALGFLNGKQYAQIEAAGCYELPKFDVIEELLFPERESHAFSFTWESQEDIRVSRQRFAEWRDNALKALAGDDGSPRHNLVSPVSA